MVHNLCVYLLRAARKKNYGYRKKSDPRVMSLIGMAACYIL